MCSEASLYVQPRKLYIDNNAYLTSLLYMDRTAHPAKQVAQAPSKLTCSLFHLIAISEPCLPPSPFPQIQSLFSKSSREPDSINFIVVQMHSSTQSRHSRQADNFVPPALKQSARGAQLKHFARIVHLPLTGRSSAPFGILHVQLNVRRETDDRWGELT